MTRQEIAERLIEHQIVRTSLKAPESRGPSRQALLLKAFGDNPTLFASIQKADIDQDNSLFTALGIEENDVINARCKQAIRVLHDDIQRLQKRLATQQKLKNASNYPEIVAQCDQDVREILIETSFRTQLPEEIQSEFIQLCARENDILERSVSLLNKIMDFEKARLKN